MRRNHLFAVVLLVVFSLAFFKPNLTPLLSNLSPNAAKGFPSIVGSGATSEENIDSFDVHPANRWTETVTSYTTTVETDGYLNSSDIGDGTKDFYKIARELRDLDGSIEFSFRLESNGTTNDIDNNFRYALIGDDGTFFNVYFRRIRSSAVETFLLYSSEESTEAIAISEQEITVGNWYRLRIDYDILQSEMRVRGFNNSGTKLFDYNWPEIDEGGFPSIFATSTLRLELITATETSGQLTESHLDYVKAPFKEREWRQIVSSSDGDWLDDSPYINRAQDDIDDTNAWQLAIPYLDFVSAHMTIETDDLLDPGNENDVIFYQFGLYAIDFDDGDQHQIINFRVWLGSSGSGGALGRIYVNRLLAGEVIVFDNAPSTDTVSVDLDIELSLINDRTDLSFTITGYINGDTEDTFIYGGLIDIDNAYVDASQEFVIESFCNIDFDFDTEVVLGLTSLSIIERDIFSDLGGLISDVIGGGTDFFTAVFRWIVSVITDFLEVMLDLLLAGLDGIFSALGDVITELQGLASDIATAIWDGVGSALDFITEAITAVFDELAAVMDDVVDAVLTQLAIIAEDIADFLFATIDFLLDLLLNVVDEITALLIGILFFLWNFGGSPGDGLPDLLAVVDGLLVLFVAVITGIPQLITDLGDLVGIIFNISIWGGMLVFFALPITVAPTPGEWIVTVLEFMSFDLTFGLTILGVGMKVPAGAVWIVFMIGSGVLSGALIGGFF